MTVSRRDFGVLLAALAASAPVSPPDANPAGTAQTTGAGATPLAKLDTKLYHHRQIPYAGTDQKKGRRFFMGETHGGFNLEMHETILAVGVETHAPHRHLHEEIILVVEGSVETYNEGRTEVVEPGSVIFFGSNQMHSARNVGKVPCRYYVVELRGDE